MPSSALFAVLLFIALVLAAGAAFAPLAWRRRVRVGLKAALVLVWASLGVALWQIGLRTSLALAAPGSARRPQLISSALSELWSLLLSLGGPAAIVSMLGVWALRSTRPDSDAPERRRKRKTRAKIAAVREAKDLEDVRRLFEEYARALDFDLGFPVEGFLEEIRALPGPYAAPAGTLLLARDGKDAVGCVAIRSSEGIAEMKRLFVRPDFRHAGLGRALTEAALEAASSLGATQIRLDTLPAMREAAGLYRSLGFRERGPFGEPPTPGAIYFERELRGGK